MANPTIKPEQPGEIIREEIAERGWTQHDLAEVMGRPLAAVNEIINGKRRITAKTASELEAALGVDGKFWMNLEANYQLAQAASTSAPSERARLMNYAPIKEMQRRNWIPAGSGLGEVRDAVLKFFGTESLSDAPKMVASFRHSSEVTTMSHVAWCTRALQMAAAQNVKPFRRKRIDELKAELRALAAYADEIRRVPRVLAEYGIRFVVVKHLTSTRIDGATLWLDESNNSKPVIAMSLRYGRIDNFWHVLCHEISHITHQDGFEIDVDTGCVTESDGDDIERRANAEAAATLIPPPELESFILRKRPYFSAKSIIQFANKVRIHPGIIVGQLQYRKAIKYTHSQNMLVQIRDSVIESAMSDGWTN